MVMWAALAIAFVLLVCQVSRSFAAVKFLAVGDWGGDENTPYYTEGQLASSKGMNAVAERIGSSFVLAAGDNFYHSGIASDAHDARFKETFEDVYTGEALQTPWLAIAGNHDHKGNVSAQIAYSELSERWTYPSQFHSHSFESDGVSVDILMIDTVELASSSILAEDDPKYFDPLPELGKEHAAKWWKWIEDHMKESTAQHLLVVGHYPVWSVCEHGPTLTLVRHLKPLLEKYGAHYISGHDHCMEHFQETGKSVNYFLAGMGVECCYRVPLIMRLMTPHNSLKWHIASDNAPSGVSAGFASFIADSDGLKATFHDQDGNDLYVAPTVPPRKVMG